jgi:hypothetical protein
MGGARSRRWMRPPRSVSGGLTVLPMEFPWLHLALRASTKLPASDRPSASSDAAASPISPQPGFPMLVQAFVTGL